jgi:hypothetical protein
MDLSIPKDAPDVSEDAPPEEDTSESFPNQEKDSETAAPVTADPLANLKADFESQKAVFESRETFDSSPADVDMKPAGKKNPPALSTAVESSEDITPLHSAATAAGGDDRKSAPATAKDRKDARKMRRKKRQNADVDKKPAGDIDRLELAPGVESSEDFSPLHNTAAAAAAINQASTYRESRLPPSEQQDDDSSSFTISTSSARPGAVYVGGSESNHDELPLQTQEEPGMEQGFETILPIAAEAVPPDHESENNKEIAEAQIVDTAPETATLCGQPRWLIFALLGVLGTIAIGAGVSVALGNGGDDPQLSDRGIELQNRIIDEIPSSQFGSSQIKVIKWLANEDLLMLDFETTPFETIMERYAMVTLYYSLNGPQWEDQDGFLSEKSVCSWGNITCDPLVTEISWFNNSLHGQLPTELGFLTGLRSLDFGKFATISSSELGTITLLRSLSYKISPLWFCRD